MKCPRCHRIWLKDVIETMLHWYTGVAPDHCIWCAPEGCYPCYAKRTTYHVHNEDDNTYLER